MRWLPFARSKVPSVSLRTVYPCCKGDSRIAATIDVPREVYERRCPHCGDVWEVERRTANLFNGRRIDILDWTRVSDGETLTVAEEEL